MDEFASGPAPAGQDTEDETGTVSRRYLIGVGAALSAGLAASAAHAQSFKDTVAGEHNDSAKLLGSRNQGLETLDPSAVNPPPTDHGSVPQFWQSFSQSHRRIQDGGWARQVNVTDFPISKEIASVNMKLNAGGVRELHWHAADEWSLMLAGNARLTAIDYDGRPYVKDVKAGDLWYFPQGIPHSIQGLGPDGCEFLLVFNQGTFSEEGTTLLTDWVIHTPREVVAQNFGCAQDALKPFGSIPPEGRYIFQAPVPPALAEDAAAVDTGTSPSSLTFDFAMLEMKPTKEDANGSIRIVDQKTFKVSKDITMAYVVVKPGAMREMHWHTNADEWQYYISGKARMTLFTNHSDARTINFAASDVGYAPVTLPHYIENVGSDDLIYLEMFRAPTCTDISLNEWLAAIPPELVEQHLSLDKQVLAAIPKGNSGIVPRGA
jgi:oxalate decarboxylase